MSPSFIQTDPSDTLLASFCTIVSRIQLAAVRVLELLVSKGDVSVISLKSTNTALISKLFLAVHRGETSNQPQLLRALHVVVTSPPISSRRLKSRSDEQQGPLPNNSSSMLPTSNDNLEPLILSEGFNPLLIQTLIDGISLESNRSVVQHWIDFILQVVPRARSKAPAPLLALCECIISQFDRLTRRLEAAAISDDFNQLGPVSVELNLLPALDRLIGLVLANYTPLKAGSTRGTERSLAEEAGGGLLGYVSTVFAVESEATLMKRRDGEAMPVSLSSRSSIEKFHPPRFIKTDNCPPVCVCSRHAWDFAV